MNTRTEPVFTYTEQYPKDDPIIKFSEYIKEHGWWFGRPGEKPVNILDPIPQRPQLLQGPNMNLISASLAQQMAANAAAPAEIATIDSYAEFEEPLVVGDKPTSANPEDTMAPFAADGETPTIKTSGPGDAKQLLALAEGLIASDPVAKMLFDQQMAGLEKMVGQPLSEEEKKRQAEANMIKFQKRLEIRAHNQQVEVAANKRRKAKRVKQQVQAKKSQIQVHTTPDNPVLAYRVGHHNGTFHFVGVGHLPQDQADHNPHIWNLHGKRVKGFPRDPVAYINGDGTVYLSPATWQQPPAGYLPVYLGARSFPEVNRIMEGISAS